jgi:hypothetical protein
MSKAYDKSRKLELSTKEKIPSFYNVIIFVIFKSLNLVIFLMLTIHYRLTI